MASTVRNTPWISYREAQRRLAVGRRSLLALVKTGSLSVRRVPGSKPKVRSDEVAALEVASTIPASAVAS